MPELPDVETLRRYLDETALQQRIGKVEVRDAAVLQNESAGSLQTRLKGHEFKSTRRHGKHLFVEVIGRGESQFREDASKTGGTESEKRL